MDKKQQLDFDICQVILFSQLLIEGMERIRFAYPQLYKQNLKRHINGCVDELDKVLEVYDGVYDEAEDFLLDTQKKLELLTPMLRKANIDELSMIPFFVEAYRKDRLGVEKFLEGQLND